MKQLRIIAAIILAFAALQLHSQAQNRQFKSIRALDESIELMVSDGRYLITPLDDFIVHTVFYPDGKLLNDFSFAADMKSTHVDFTLVEEGNSIIVKSAGINIKITKNPFSLAYLFNDQQILCENRGFVQSDSLQLLNFSIDKNEVLYGGGARVLGMNRRGNRLMLYNRAHYGYETRSELMNYTMPVYVSSKKYAVLFDNASLGYLDLDSHQTNEITYETIDGTPNYFVIAGNTWYQLTDQFTRLTGRQPLPPRWAFGNFSSRFGYHSQKETEQTVGKFFKDKIPLDAVIIDIYWFGKEIKGTMGNLDWYRDSFPNPGRMIRKFERKGVKTILVTEPFILTTSNRWNEAVDKSVLATDGNGNPFTYDFYFGNTGLIDIFDPKARAWFWDIYSNLTNQGIGGWWGDLGEPEVHPPALHHINGTADQVHNAYGHEWCKMIYEGYRNDFPKQRPFILMRAGFAGSQRYGLIPWSGDVSRSWGGLVPQPEISLQMGLQGIAYMHSDLGGFAGGDTINNELFTRWLQYGVFQPVFRPHAQEHIPAEPVFQNEVTKSRAREAINLRYRMMPYNYSMAFENNQNGKPLMMPLFFIDDNNRLLTYDSAYMWGDAFLVSPVKAPGIKTQQIYLPKGFTWTDFYSGDNYPGGQDILANLVQSHIPIYIKGGSFIPMTKNAHAASDYAIDPFEMHYYADTLQNFSHYHLYNDDGSTPNAFEKGDFELMEFTATRDNTSLNFEYRQTRSGGRFIKARHHFPLIIHNLGRKPMGIRFGNSTLSPAKWTWDEQKHLLTVPAMCDANGQKFEIIL